MKIAHFSDLHICADYRKENIQSTRDAIEYALKAGCDHFAITGDLSHLGSKRDYEILRHLFESYGLLDPEKLSLTIGNHDIFGGVQLAEDLIHFPRRCKTVNLRKKTESFIEFFRESFDNFYPHDQEHVFPFAKVVQDVVFFGIISPMAYSIVKNPTASNGHVSKTHRQLLANLICRNEFQNKLKIVLIHHHFYKHSTLRMSRKCSWWDRIESHTMKLYKKHRLLTLFSQYGIDLVLHGHVHEYKRYQKRNVVFLNGAGCFADKRRQNLEMNIILTSSKHFEIERHHFPSSLKKPVFAII